MTYVSNVARCKGRPFGCIKTRAWICFGDSISERDLDELSVGPEIALFCGVVGVISG
jgi:hypothetical protein